MFSNFNNGLSDDDEDEGQDKDSYFGYINTQILQHKFQHQVEDQSQSHTPQPKPKKLILKRKKLKKSYQNLESSYTQTDLPPLQKEDLIKKEQEKNNHKTRSKTLQQKKPVYGEDNSKNYYKPNKGYYQSSSQTTNSSSHINSRNPEAKGLSTALNTLTALQALQVLNSIEPVDRFQGKIPDPSRNTFGVTGRNSSNKFHNYCQAIFEKINSEEMNDKFGRIKSASPDQHFHLTLNPTQTEERDLSQEIMKRINEDYGQKAKHFSHKINEEINKIIQRKKKRNINFINKLNQYKQLGKESLEEDKEWQKFHEFYQKKINGISAKRKRTIRLKGEKARGYSKEREREKEREFNESQNIMELDMEGAREKYNRSLPRMRTKMYDISPKFHMPTTARYTLNMSSQHNIQSQLSKSHDIQTIHTMLSNQTENNVKGRNAELINLATKSKTIQDMSGAYNPIKSPKPPIAGTEKIVNINNFIHKNRQFNNEAVLLSTNPGNTSPEILKIHDPSRPALKEESEEFLMSSRNKKLCESLKRKCIDMIHESDYLRKLIKKGKDSNPDLIMKRLFNDRFFFILLINISRNVLYDRKRVLTEFLTKRIHHVLKEIGTEKSIEKSKEDLHSQFESRYDILEDRKLDLIRKFSKKKVYLKPEMLIKKHEPFIIK